MPSQDQQQRDQRDQDFLRETNRIAGTLWVICGGVIGWTAVLVIWRIL